MMEYDSSRWRMFVPLIRKSLNRRYGKAYTKELLEKTDGIYRDLLNRADDIGKDNPMAGSLYSALVFFALWTAAEGTISAEDLREIVDDVISFPLLKVMGLFNVNRPFAIRQLEKMMHRDAEWLEQHPQYKAASWDFHFDETRHRDGFYYHFTQCPINSFARREGYLEILPIMCDTDFKTAALMHARLHREHTLASGGTICDYWYVGDQWKDPQ